MFKNVLIALNFLLILALGIYLVVQQKPVKQAYVLNQRVFDEFKGKQELEKKLLELQKAHKTQLDSLELLIQRSTENKGLIGQHHDLSKNFELQQRDLSDRYTADIWKRINQYIEVYGKENGYSFIFGATGDGNLMYADNVNNITDDVIAYINDKYEASD